MILSDLSGPTTPESYFCRKLLLAGEQTSAHTVHPVGSSRVTRAAALVFLDRLDEARAVDSSLLQVQPNTSIARSRRSHYRNEAMLKRFLGALSLAGVPE